MIEIRDKRVYFYNMHNREVPSVDFQCMSAYVCPHCKTVLAAYYAGEIVDLGPFMEDPSLKHYYTLGSSNGGQYLLLEQRYHETKCVAKREAVSLAARGITHQLDVWAKRYEVGPENLQVLCQMTAAGKIPGFEIVTDACGADAPIVLYNEREFTGINNPDFEGRSARRDNLSAYVGWVAAGDYSKPFEPPVKPEVAHQNDVDLPPQEDIGSGASNLPEDSKIIDIYTRTQAIEDGVLIDVTETAKEAGVVYPVAVTHALWEGYITPPEGLKGIQDIQGRLWDVLTMFAFNARAARKANTDVIESQKDVQLTLYFKTLFQMPSRNGGSPKMETVNLKAVCGPGDNAEQVVTIMLESED